jgi:predicted HD phosphohydrolase
VFHQRGDRHHCEHVTELEHALQTAEFARPFGEPDEIVLSCLQHDFCHMLHDAGEDIELHGIDAKYEELGAGLLESYFPESTREPIRQHVAAKH